MAGTVHLYRWDARRDTIWHVCARYLLAAGYVALPTFVTATRAANPTILDWMDVPDQTAIVLPYVS